MKLSYLIFSPEIYEYELSIPDCHKAVTVEASSPSNCKIYGTGLQYRGCHSSLTRKVLLMPVRGIGIRDIAEIKNISIRKVLSVSVNSRQPVIGIALR